MSPEIRASESSGPVNLPSLPTTTPLSPFSIDSLPTALPINLTISGVNSVSTMPLMSYALKIQLGIFMKDDNKYKKDVFYQTFNISSESSKI